MKVGKVKSKWLMWPLRRIYSFIERFYSTHEFTPWEKQNKKKRHEKRLFWQSNWPTFVWIFRYFETNQTENISAAKIATLLAEYETWCRIFFPAVLGPVWNLHNRRSLGGEIGKVFYCQIICCAPLPSGIIHKYSSCREFLGGFMFYNTLNTQQPKFLETKLHQTIRGPSTFCGPLF